MYIKSTVVFKCLLIPELSGYILIFMQLKMKIKCYKGKKIKVSLLGLTKGFSEQEGIQERTAECWLGNVWDLLSSLPSCQTHPPNCFIVSAAHASQEPL